jgi:2-succinyl-6-hydroxy-2,4-cyclohexadiene-1-carboxylate synthase
VESQRWHSRDMFLGVRQQNATLEQTQTLVLLHGFTGSSASWAGEFTRPGSAHRRLIALDMPGHGQSSAPTDVTRYQMEQCQADILTVLQALGVQKHEAILLGYSMGGRIALALAFSDFFRALILESASPGLADPLSREQRRLSDNALADRIENEGVAAFVTYWESLPLFASLRNLPPETQAALHAQRLNNRALGLANSLRGIGTGVQPALHARLHSLHIPVLLLAGELDQKFGQIAHSMAQQLPQARLQIVPGSGHTTHLERPDIFAQLVDEFCQNIYL